MNKKDKDKLFDIRCRSKRGEYVSIEEDVFCRTMNEKWKDEYKLMDREIFLATAPFGSKI